VNLEASKAKAEALMMEVEDQRMQHMVAEERIMIKKECFLVGIFSCNYMLGFIITEYANLPYRWKRLKKG